jgi:hypothetical protein
LRFPPTISLQIIHPSSTASTDLDYLAASRHQLDLQALHRVRERLVRQRTGIINQIVPSCWSAALRCARGSAFCAANCPRQAL